MTSDGWIAVLFFARLAAAGLAVPLLTALVFRACLRLGAWKHRRDVHKLGMWPLPIARLRSPFRTRFAARALASFAVPYCAKCYSPYRSHDQVGFCPTCFCQASRIRL